MVLAGIANEYLLDSYCVATPRIRRAGVNRMAMVEAATNGIAFDKLDTHSGLIGLSLEFEDSPKSEFRST